MEVLCEVQECQLIEVEQQFIDQYQSWQLGYNISQVAGRSGRTSTFGKKLNIRVTDKEWDKLKAYSDKKRVEYGRGHSLLYKLSV